MVGEIAFLRAGLTRKNEIVESLLLSQSMLHDEFLYVYKFTFDKISGKTICDNRSINYYDRSVNTNETPLEQNQFTENSLISDSSYYIERN